MSIASRTRRVRSLLRANIAGCYFGKTMQRLNLKMQAEVK
jgi:hypothetical protein